jgi:D-lactate dehydrogenase (cytochrome)
MTPSNIRTNVEEEFPDYLRDESRRVGCADSISFPRSEDELREQLLWLAEQRVMVTTQGARTGIAGGATPNGGHVLNLSRMSSILGLKHVPGGEYFILTVQPGVLLSDVQQGAAKKRFATSGWSEESIRTLDELAAKPGGYMFAPDLTEVSASIGGLVACNGSGSRSFRYGATRAHVARVRGFLADGTAIDLERGKHKTTGRTFELPLAGGRILKGRVPGYGMPAVKNAAGYFAEDDMDLVDVLIGSEGTLAVFSEIDIVLIPAPPVIWGITAFLPDEDSALRLVESARTKTRPGAIEFVSSGALDLLRHQKADNPAFKDIPSVEDDWHTGVYVEYHGKEDDVIASVEALSEILETCNGDPDATWLASNEKDITRFKAFRHAIPESVNLLIDERRKADSRLTKLGTDLSVPDECLQPVMAMYRHDLTDLGLEFVSFGHIGNNHVHVNIIPRNMDEYEKGKDLYLRWAGKVVVMGGSVSAEHGIGKLKTRMLEIMYGANGISEMRELKRIFDPDGRLNRGNLFSWD